MSALPGGPLAHAVSTYRDPALYAARRIEDADPASPQPRLTSSPPLARHGWPHPLRSFHARQLPLTPSTGGLR